MSPLLAGIHPVMSSYLAPHLDADATIRRAARTSAAMRSAQNAHDDAEPPQLVDDDDGLDVLIEDSLSGLEEALKMLLKGDRDGALAKACSVGRDLAGAV